MWGRLVLCLVLLNAALGGVRGTNTRNFRLSRSLLRNPVAEPDYSIYHRK